MIAQNWQNKFKVRVFELLRFCSLNERDRLSRLHVAFRNALNDLVIIVSSLIGQYTSIFIIICVIFINTMANNRSEKMTWNIGDFNHMIRANNINIASLPRYPICDRSKWQINNKMTKYWPQKLCSHQQPYHSSISVKHNYQCLNYMQHIERRLNRANSTDSTEDALSHWSYQWHKRSREGRLQILAQIIFWYEDSKHAKQQYQAYFVDKNGSNAYPLTYDILLWDHNGFGRVKVCRTFLCHLLKCGHTTLRNLIGQLWASRSSKELIPLLQDEYNTTGNDRHSRRNYGLDYDYILQKFCNHGSSSSFKLGFLCEI